MENKCPIWGFTADVEMLPNDSLRVYSPRSGGKYTITGTRAILAENFNEDQRMLVTTWLVKQRSLGNAVPHVSDNLEIESIRKPSIIERAENLLKYINSQTSNISDIFESPRFVPKEHQSLMKSFLEMLAWSDSNSLEDLNYLLKFLENQGWISRPPSSLGYTSPDKLWVVTVLGHIYLSDLKSRIIDSTQAFVAMWFSSCTDDAYYEGIKPGIEDARYSPVRIDEKPHLNKIDDEIIAEIRRSKFVVADFTHGNDGARGGVYYEAGFAHGLNIPVFFTCREDLHDKIHFDTRQYLHIFWKNPADLRKSLSERISALLGDGPVKD